MQHPTSHPFRSHHAESSAPDGVFGTDRHVVDYKTSQVSDEATLRSKIAAYQPQVRAYAEAIRGRVPGKVGSYALWFVSGSVVARWAVA